MRDHRRRGRARRQAYPVEGQHRGRAGRLSERAHGRHGAPHRWGCRMGRGSRHLVPRTHRRPGHRGHARADAGRGSSLHSVHLRLHRKAQGRAARHGRIPLAGRHDAQVCVRLPRRRHLLVHRRRRLDHRTLLHRVRPARQRRHDPDVRRRAYLSRRLALLAGHRQAPGKHLLHRPDGAAAADEPRR